MREKDEKEHPERVPRWKEAEGLVWFYDQYRLADTWMQLVACLTPMVFSIFRAVTAVVRIPAAALEEAVADFFNEFYCTKLEMWDRQRPFVPLVRKRARWRAQNLLHKYLRKQQVERDVGGLTRWTYSNADPALSAEALETCERALDQLSRNEQVVFFFVIFSQLSYTEIACAFGVSKRYIHKLRTEALRKLAAAMRGAGLGIEEGREALYRALNRRMTMPVNR